jgi:hypothetical protein
MSDTYVCELCGGSFVSDRPEAAAQAESVELWGRRRGTPEMAIVCEDCFLMVMAWLRARGHNPVPS